MRRQAIPVAAALLTATTFLAACGEGEGGPAGQPIDREVFIDAYVELRLAASEAADFVITPERRDEILSRHGVDQQRLLHFADVHGPDVDFMNEVWAEVERRLEERRPSSGGSA